MENIYHVAVIKSVSFGHSVKDYQYFAQALYEFLPLTWTYQELTKSKTISYQNALDKINKIPNPSEKYDCKFDYDQNTRQFVLLRSAVLKQKKEDDNF